MSNFVAKYAGQLAVVAAPIYEAAVHEDTAIRQNESVRGVCIINDGDPPWSVRQLCVQQQTIKDTSYTLMLRGRLWQYLVVCVIFDVPAEPMTELVFPSL
jgi:hypothetical protein